MVSSCSDFHVHNQKSFRIKHEEEDTNNKFFARLFSKQQNSNQTTNFPSFRIPTSAVPFIWESQPGTPKIHTFSHQTSNNNNNLLPPLTPPPSYYSNKNNSEKNPIKKNSRSNLFHSLIKNLLNPKASHLPPSPSSWSYLGDDHQEVSTRLCFGRSCSEVKSGGGNQDCVFMKKKPLFSILRGQRSI